LDADYPENGVLIACRFTSDGTYVVEFRTSGGDSLAISVPRGETAVLQHFQAQMPYGLFVPDAQ
jgi:hypothetical protein